MQAHSTLNWSSLALVMLICSRLHAADVQVVATPVDFANDVAPILQAKCVECHDASMQMAELRLDSREAILDAGVVVPGDADNSLVLQRLQDRDLGILMPPTGRLDETEIDVLKKWIDSGALWPPDVTLTTKSSAAKQDARSKAIFAVVRNADVDALQEMLRDKSLIHATDNYGATPLMRAALYSSAQSVKLLLDHDADPNAADDDGMTALMFAVSDLAKVRLLLDHGAKVETRSKLGRTSLLLASAYAGNADVVSTLLDAGADVNYADSRGWTSVVLAARTGDSELVRTLLDAGGDVNGGDSQRLSPGTPLMQAAWASDVECAKLLLARGAHPDERSVNTALIFAATHGSLELVELLLGAGADPQAHVVTNYVPESPILAAAYSDSLNAEIVKILVSKEVDIQKEDKRGETPLSIARKRGRTEIVTLLLQSAGNNGTDEGDSAPKAAEDRSMDEDSVKQFAQKSISLLQSCGPQFYANSGCVACHQQTASSLVVQMARERGFRVDERVARQQVKLTSVDLGKKRVGFLQRMKIGGTSHRVAYLLWGMAMADYPADEITDAAFVELAGLQLRNGSWVSDAHRPPTEYSPVTATAVSLRALQHYAPPGLQTATAARVARATQWLVDAQASANAEKAFRLLGLHWGGADTRQIAKAKRDLLKEQASSGGWSQLPALAPDAYATGLTLYALYQTGCLSATDPAYRRGVAFLMKTRKDDGSWHVRSRSFAIQPYFESGFPHGHDQWISAAASSWATMALLQTIDPTTVTKSGPSAR